MAACYQCHHQSNWGSSCWPHFIALHKAWTSYYYRVVDMGLSRLAFWAVNTGKPQQNGQQCADDIFKLIFLAAKFHILIKISVNYASEGISSGNCLAAIWHKAIASPSVDQNLVMPYGITRPHSVNISFTGKPASWSAWKKSRQIDQFSICLSVIVNSASRHRYLGHG